NRLICVSFGSKHWPRFPRQLMQIEPSPNGMSTSAVAKSALMCSHGRTAIAKPVQDQRHSLHRLARRTWSLTTSDDLEMAVPMTHASWARCAPTAIVKYTTVLKDEISMSAYRLRSRPGKMSSKNH